MQIFSNKADARKFFLQKRKELTQEQISLFSEQLSQQLISLEQFKQADTVLFYYPTRNEPELFLAINAAFRAGKSVAFPISLTDTLTLDFRVVNDLSELEVGAYGIREPKYDVPKASCTERTLCVVPALAFDENALRLGYGKGYYDRFLADFKGTSAGLFYEGFFCKSLPSLNTDVAVDILITTTGVIER